MAVKIRVRPFKESAPIRDIRARIPPSPSLSARMTKRQYFTETVMISVQMIREKIPRADWDVKCPPTAVTIVCKV